MIMDEHDLAMMPGKTPSPQEDAEERQEWDTPTLTFRQSGVDALRSPLPSWDTTTQISNLEIGGVYRKQITRDFALDLVIEAIIGQGGVGTVYRAHGPDGTQYAIKEIKLPDDRADPDRGILPRFIREARIMQTLRHPGIVPVLAQWHSPFRYWLLMPYIGGGTLYHRLHPQASSDMRLPVPDACAYALQLLDALSVAHTQTPPVIHRDLKPINILIDGNDADHLLIADWGSAHEIGQHLTQIGVSIGTPAYMAPEQLYLRNPEREDDPIGPWTDIYAMGLILYEMLAGVPPFIGDTTTVALAQLHEPPDMGLLMERNHEVNDGLCSVIEKALDKSPRRRYESAREFARYLGPFVEVWE